MQIDCESIKFAYLSICCACFSLGCAAFRFSRSLPYIFFEYISLVLAFVLFVSLWLSVVVCLWQHILITSSAVLWPRDISTRFA